jgi:hypothetical protein
MQLLEEKWCIAVSTLGPIASGPQDHAQLAQPASWIWARSRYILSYSFYTLAFPASMTDP